MSNHRIIIVGAGSAGCLLARSLDRLGQSVTLIEAPSGSAPAIDRQRPARWLNLISSDEDWDFATTDNDALAGRSLRWPRGRGMGGSCRINAMIWFPPTPADIASFASSSHWNIEQIETALKKIESIVKPESPRWLSPSAQYFLSAAAQSPTDTPMTYRRLNRRGRRWNPAELLENTNVQVVRARVDRVVLTGDQATGIELTNGEIVSADRIVLCSGTIGSPAILMRSGIGPRDVLSKANIDIRFESPGIGENLQDHLVMPVIFATEDTTRFRDRPSMRELAQWEVAGSGPLACNIAECGGLFADGRIQIHATPTHYLSYPSSDAASAMTIAVNVTQPKSRGRLIVGSADSAAAPQIMPNYFSEEADLQTTIEGVCLARRLSELEPMGGLIKRELLPGSKRQSDASISKAVRRYCQTLYHPVGTCAMGEVVDEQFSVVGVERLKVVDASVLAEITTGNPNAMVMTIAHLASEVI